MSKSLYRVTRSEVDTVPVGMYLIDNDTGQRQAWTVFYPGSSNIRHFGGVRTHRLCEECLNRPESLVRVYGHDHAHGEGSTLDPDA